MSKKKFDNFIKSKKIGLILYARMSSKRFPGKVMKKIYNNQNICEIIVNKISKIGLKSKIVIATSSKKNDQKIVKFCKEKKIRYFIGNNENVFHRTTECIKKYKFKYFVRICADRPLFDTDIMIKMIKLIINKDYDIITNVYPRTFPKGLTCEVAKTNIFKNINQKYLLKKDKEHIFGYYYRNKTYKIHNIKSKFNRSFINKNFCIDTQKDLKKIKNIFFKLEKLKKKINTTNIYKFI